MLVLDENIREPQADLLRNLGITFRKIEVDLAPKGTGDPEIIPLLLRLKQPTFITHDTDFWNPRLCHEGYCLVFLGVKPRDAAAYIRRFLRHPLFNTNAKRLGKVIHVHADGIAFIVGNNRQVQRLPWMTQSK